MATIKLQENEGLNDLIKSVEQLDIENLEKFLERVLLIRAKKIAPTISKKEANLLTIINQPIPEKLLKEFKKIDGIKKERKLLKKEHLQLTKILSAIEKLNADRLVALATLSKIQQKPLKQLMTQFGVGQNLPHG